MGAWGYYAWPSEPPDEPEGYDPDRGWWEEMAEQESLSAFIEQEMSYEEAVAEDIRVEDIATDEGGWGAWMGGEL